MLAWIKQLSELILQRSVSMSSDTSKNSEEKWLRILIIFPFFLCFFDNLDVWIHMFFMVGFLQTFFKTLAITFSSMAVFIGTPLYGQSLRYAGPASLIWGWVVVTFFTWFVGIAMAEICSSFPVYILISYIYIYIYMFISHRVPLPLFTPRNYTSIMSIYK